ncbi:Hypothetical_protein [Hexamita inflata]|uniref:Hypothetical_protein n=1 Tax=Hexamita inflata TaxID=28002 RepID=A0AA86TG67_9EUKA|nr:Hypothetical protein HINF_LOCUS18 [Hexamita inflata]
MQPVSYSNGGNRYNSRFKVAVLGRSRVFKYGNHSQFPQKTAKYRVIDATSVIIQTADDLIQQLIISCDSQRFVRSDPSATNAVLLQLNASRPIQLEKYRGLSSTSRGSQRNGRELESAEIMSLRRCI